MNKLLVICGPTATGKTDLGIKLAKKFSGEIVSADSRQVYRYMDVGTGKDVGNAKFKMQNSKLKFKIKNFQIGHYLVKKIPIWLLDVVKPNYKFSVADYVKCAQVVIEDIWKRNKLPILVGGTGFYIKGLIDGYETMGVEPDWELRERLKNLRTEELKNILKKLNPQRLRTMNKSDRNNPRRLIRAIEVVSKTQNLKGKAQNYNLKLKTEDILMIGLKTDYQSLYQRIDKRVEERVKQGMVEEIQGLLKRGYSWENSVLGTTIGYREWQDYISCCVSRVSCHESKDEVIQKWQFSEHAYARRQMTWFKKVLRLCSGLSVLRGVLDAYWFDISQKGWENGVEKLVKNWYSKK